MLAGWWSHAMHRARLPGSSCTVALVLGSSDCRVCAQRGPCRNLGWRSVEVWQGLCLARAMSHVAICVGAVKKCVDQTGNASLCTW